MRSRTRQQSKAIKMMYRFYLLATIVDNYLDEDIREHLAQAVIVPRCLALFRNRRNPNKNKSNYDYVTMSELRIFMEKY